MTKGGKKMKLLCKTPLGSVGKTLAPYVCDNSTTSAVTCICGNGYPELPENGGESYHTGTFLGEIVLLSCCGMIFEIAYAELGMRFIQAKLIEEVAENPLGNRFLLSYIDTAIQRAKERLEKAGACCGNIQKNLETIK
ncbi:MAG TPA: hypothetical protein VF817_03295 [Patescibacteria group bacterium]